MKMPPPIDADELERGAELELEVRELLDALDRMGGGPPYSSNVARAIAQLRRRFPAAVHTFAAADLHPRAS